MSDEVGIGDEFEPRGGGHRHVVIGLPRVKGRGIFVTAASLVIGLVVSYPIDQFHERFYRP